MAADRTGTDRFDAAAIAWLLEHAPARSACSGLRTTGSSAPIAGA